MKTMKIPTLKIAREMLDEANKKNPGPWADHTKVVAETAGIIAEKSGMNPEDAYVLGLIHDIGRREGWTYIRHIVDGYRYLFNMGYEDAAAICLTHSFPFKDLRVYSGDYDCSGDDLKFIKDFINTSQYSDYDKLIQLCDAISLPNGPVLIEKRLVDVAMRYGVNEWTLHKWKAIFEIKNYFDEKTGCGVYRLMPDIERNTFEWGYSPDK